MTRLLEIRIQPRAKRPGPGRPPSATPSHKITEARSLLEPVTGKRAVMPPLDHPAITSTRTTL